MEENRTDITRSVFANYESIERRAQEERSKAMSKALASVAPFIWHCLERAAGSVRSTFRARRRSA